MPEVPLYRREGVVGYALVDEEDRERVAAHRWSLWAIGPARKVYIDGWRTSTTLARAVLAIKPDDPRKAQHLNGDRTDCRRANLRTIGGVDGAVIDGADCRIPLRTNGGGVVGWTVIDTADLPLVERFTWRLNTAGYVITGKGRSRQRLHRVVLGLPKGADPEVDHADRDPLNNRRSNLRVCSRAENAQNLPAFGRSRYRGVSWAAHASLWAAQVTVGGQTHHLGYFKTEDAAGAATAEFRRRVMPFATD